MIKIAGRVIFAEVFSTELAPIGRVVVLHAVGCEFEPRILHNFLSAYTVS